MTSARIPFLRVLIFITGMLVLQLSWASCTFKTQIKFQDGTLGCLEELQIADQIPRGETQKLSSVVASTSNYVIARSINNSCNALGIGTSRSTGVITNIQSLSKVAIDACKVDGCDCQPIIADGNALVSKEALFGLAPSTDKYDGQWRGTFSCTAYAGLERENPAFSYEIKGPSGNGINIEHGLIEIEEQKKNASGVPFRVVWKGSVRNGKAELSGEGIYPRSSYRMELKGAPENDRTIKLTGPLSVGMSAVRECTIALESVKPAPGSLASKQEEVPPSGANTAVVPQEKTTNSSNSSVSKDQSSSSPKLSQTLDAKSQQEVEAKAKQEAVASKAQQEAEAKAKAKQEAVALKAQQEADAKAKQESITLKAQQDAEAKAKARQEALALKAQQEAEAKAKQEAEAKAKQEAVALKAQQEVEAKARAQQEAIAMKAQQDQAGKDRLRQEANDLKAKLEASMKMDSKAKQVREPSAQVPRQQDAPSIGATQEAEVKSVPQIIAPATKPSPTPKQGPIVVKSILDL